MAAPLAAIAAKIAADQLRKRGAHKDLFALAGGGAVTLVLAMTMIAGGSQDPAAADCVPADDDNASPTPTATTTPSSPGTPDSSGTPKPPGTPKPSRSTSGTPSPSDPTYGPSIPSSSSSTFEMPTTYTLPGGARGAKATHKEDDPGRGSFELPKPDPGDLEDVPHAIAPAKPIPKHIKKMYVEAGKRYGIPWTLLAGIGMVESHHGTLPGYEQPNSYGAGGLMAWIDKYFESYKKDGDGDGAANWGSDADQVHTTAYRLSIEGAKKSPEGVKEALFSYNRANWYVALVLDYSHKYGSGTVTAGGGSACTTPAGDDTSVACPSGKADGQLVGLNKGRPWLKPQLVQLGKKLQKQGWRVGEHPDFGGNHPEYHGEDSLHGYGLAIDVNGPGEQNGAADKLATKLWKQGFGVQWKAPNHDDHLHIDVGMLGRIFSYGSYVSNPNAGKLSCEPGGKKTKAALNAALPAAAGQQYATAPRRRQAKV